MMGNLYSWAALTVLIGTVPTWAQQEPADARSTTPAALPAASNLQREYARLAQLLNSNDTFGRREAASTLLRVRPIDVANPETRKLIARGYRSLALDERGGSQDEAIQGLVIWGGKYSVSVLIEMLDEKKLGISDELFTALGKLRDPRGAEAVARHLGNFFNHDRAVLALRRMGPAAEDALIATAPSNDPKVCMAAVQLLGEIGGEKSLKLLQKAAQSNNQQIKMVARDAVKRIRQRQKSGPAAVTPDAIDPNSPFAEGVGPAVDITAHNSRDLGDRGNELPAVGGDRLGKNGVPDAELEGTSTSDLSEGDWSQVNALLPGEPTGAGVPPDPAVDPTELNWRPQPCRLGKMLSAHERPEAMDIAGGASPTAVVVHNDPFSESIGRMEIINLRQRKSLTSQNVAGGVKHCSLSPSGERVLVAAVEGRHEQIARLDIWSIQGGKAAELCTWWPYATGDHWQNEIIWADWLDEDQLFTLNSQGMLVLWRLESDKPVAVYQIDGQSGSQPALSPGRKYLALVTMRGVEIFRSTDGELLARMGELRPSSGVVSFSSNGSHLACISGRSVYVWNVTTGRLQRDFDCNSRSAGSLVWLDDQRLLAGGTDVIDLSKRLIAWRFDGGEQLALPYGGWQWIVMQSGSVWGIVPTKPLTEDVKAAGARLDADEILALKPGVKVTLDLQLGGEQLAKAEQAIRASLKQNNVEVVSNAPLRLTARIVTGNTSTEEYRNLIGFDRKTEQVTVTEQLYEVELTVDGQAAWKQASVLQSGHTPMSIRLQENETAQQAVDRQNTQWSENFAYGVSLPRYVVHPKYAGPLGTSKLTLGGQ